MADVRKLPVPAATIWDWQLQAACRGVDSSVFFHPDGERCANKVSREARALRVCRSCPVLQECRRHALAVEEPYGVWGGQTEDERAAVLRDRRRDRHDQVGAASGWTRPTDPAA